MLNILMQSYDLSRRMVVKELDTLSFKEYLQIGYYPYFFESSSTEIYQNKLFNSLEKIIYEDIPF
ncbi:MAG: hypothetical protein J7L21_00230, partial [Sulfurimonas sp.]|nr:hypothetical protein [Sulfurimonas sp.]